MRIQIRNPDRVLSRQIAMFPPCEQWLKDHAGEQFQTIPENHIHIMADGKRRTIPIEYVEVIE